MNVIKHCLLLCFLLIAGSVSSQYNFSGTVSSQDRSKLVSALIELEGTDIAGVTEFDGTFYFEDVPAGTYTVRISYVGYEDYVGELIIDGDSNQDFALEGTYYDLDEVMIVANRVSENMPYTAKILDKQDIELRNGGQDMPILLDMIPSLVSTSDAGNGIGYTGMRIRGSDQTRINVTINGVPLNDAESQQVFWVDLPDFASSVNSIDLQRGVGPSTNGPGAFGATVALNTHDVPGDIHVEGTAGFGSFNTQRAAVKLGTGMLNDRFSVSGRYSYINSDGYIDRSNARLTSIALTPAIFWDDAVLRLDIFSGREITNQAWYGVPESKVTGDDEALFEHYFNNKGVLYNTPADSVNLFSSDRRYNYYLYDNQIDDYGQDHIQLHYYKEVSEKLNSKNTAYFTKGRGFFEEYIFDGSLPDHGVPEGYELNGETFFNNDLIRRRALNNNLIGVLTHNRWESGKVAFDIGGGYSWYGGDHFGLITEIVGVATANQAVEYYVNKGIKNDGNIYARGEYGLGNGLTLFGDVQYRAVSHSISGDDQELKGLDINRSFSFFNPKAGVSYLKHNFKAYASVAFAGREPDRNDLINAQGSEAQPESLMDVEVGTRLRYDNFNLGINGYYMDYTDQLVLTGDLNDVGANLRTNVPESFRTGIELDASAQFTRFAQLGGNLTLSRNKITAFDETIFNYTSAGDIEVISIPHSDTDISFSPNVISGAMLKLFPAKGLQGTFEFKYVGSQFLDNTANPDRQLPAYQYLNFRLGYEFELRVLRKLTLNAGVFNLLNTLYSANGYTYSYQFDGFPITENYRYPQAGTNFMVNMTVRL